MTINGPEKRYSIPNQLSKTASDIYIINAFLFKIIICKNKVMMNNTIAEATKFNKQLKAFLKDIIMVFPEDREIKIISSSLNIAMMDDPEYMIIRSFYNALSPFHALIETRNDTFFTQNPSKFDNKFTNSNQYQLFNKLNIYWETLNEHNRKIVWDYFQLLYSMSDKFIHSLATP